MAAPIPAKFAMTEDGTVLDNTDVQAVYNYDEEGKAYCIRVDASIDTAKTYPEETLPFYLEIYLGPEPTVKGRWGWPRVSRPRITTFTEHKVVVEEAPFSVVIPLSLVDASQTQ